MRRATCMCAHWVCKTGRTRRAALAKLPNRARPRRSSWSQGARVLRAPWTTRPPTLDPVGKSRAKAGSDDESGPSRRRRWISRRTGRRQVPGSPACHSSRGTQKDRCEAGAQGPGFVASLFTVNIFLCLSPDGSEVAVLEVREPPRAARRQRLPREVEVTDLVSPRASAASQAQPAFSPDPPPRHLYSEAEDSALARRLQVGGAGDQCRGHACELANAMAAQGWCPGTP